jgi:hypothetical protein
MPNSKAQIPNKCQMSKPKAQENGCNVLSLGFWISFDIGALTFGIARCIRALCWPHEIAQGYSTGRAYFTGELWILAF